jgi:hypothetical protein
MVDMSRPESASRKLVKFFHSSMSPDCGKLFAFGLALMFETGWELDVFSESGFEMSIFSDSMEEMDALRSFSVPKSQSRIFVRVSSANISNLF